MTAQPSVSTIDIWTFALDVPETDAERLGAVLSAAERDRARRFHRAQDAMRYQIAHARLREILAHSLASPPTAIAFGEGPHGKPYISAPNTTLRFNLAHSGALAAVGIAHDSDIGVDIERIKPLVGTDLEGALSAREQEMLATLAGSERLAAFYRCWTRKEALLKGVGRGLGVPLDSFDVPVDDAPDVLVSFDSAPSETARNWRIVSFTPAPGYEAAVALPAEPAGGRAILQWRIWPLAG